jgi:hypothetical protein
MLKEICSLLNAVDKRISAGNRIITKLAKSARKGWFLQLGNELKMLMFRIMAMNLVIYSSINDVQKSILDLRRA